MNSQSLSNTHIHSHLLPSSNATQKKNADHSLINPGLFFASGRFLFLHHLRLWLSPAPPSLSLPSLDPCILCTLFATLSAHLSLAQCVPRLLSLSHALAHSKLCPSSFPIPLSNLVTTLHAETQWYLFLASRQTQTELQYATVIIFVFYWEGGGVGSWNRVSKTPFNQVLLSVPFATVSYSFVLFWLGSLSLTFLFFFPGTITFTHPSLLSWSLSHTLKFIFSFLVESENRNSQPVFFFSLTDRCDLSGVFIGQWRRAKH